MTCKGCNLKGCQRMDRPPAGCLLEPGTSEGGYWLGVRRMERQERILRAGALEGGEYE
jgi:hypothetical protein